MTTIILTDEQKSSLTVILNLELRRRLGKDYATQLNGIFKQLTGHDHNDYVKRHLKEPDNG